MRQFCHTLDKQEKRYDIHCSIGYRCINKMSASKRKKKVNYTTLKVLRDTHYEYFRCMECFWFFVNILWRHVLVSRRKMRWNFFSLYIKKVKHNVNLSSVPSSCGTSAQFGYHMMFHYIE